MSLATESRVAVQKMAMWDWGIAKFASMLIGIGLVAIYPALITYFDWYWWGLGVIITMAIPVYFLYMYQTPKKATRVSKARAKYSRRK